MASSSSSKKTLPFDDLELEMEEVEGLVEVSNVGSGGKRLVQKRGGAAVTVCASICSSKYRSKWACFVILILMAVIATLVLMDEKDIQVVEESGVSDVDAKNATTKPPTMMPTSAPTTKATPPPTTAPKTPPPTAAPKTPPPTVAPKTSPPTAAPKTSPPTAAPKTPPPTAAPMTSPSPTAKAAQDETKQQTPPPTQKPKDNDTAADAVPDEIPDNTPAADDEAKDNAPKHTDYSYPSTPFAVRTENPPTPDILEEYRKTWGVWQLEDLPKMDRQAFCGSFRNCDVPRDKFPPKSWQTDKEFLTKFLGEADKLVDRARNAILQEYGKSANDTTMFDLTFREDLKEEERRELRGKGPPENGGWTTKRSMKGLARRILHAIVTRDDFTFIMGGHSAAAGHGNHFKQSYTMQVHKILEPVFSYLGVQVISRNLAQGGLGTLQSSLGAADIYGDEIDFMVWDSSMTEGRDGRAVDMFGRQALMGNRVPVLWNLNPNLLELYHDECDADIGLLGSGEIGIPVTTDEVHAESLPYAVQYYKCDQERNQMCRDHKYMANCWVERPDVTPPEKQMGKPRGQASWHPGFRWHQLVGRILAYTVLTGLKDAIAIWKEADGELPDEAWHVSEYYDNIRTKVMNLDPELGSCNDYKGDLPDRVCKVHLRGRTEFTPRADPDVTSVRSILKTDGYMPSVEGEILYDGPDVRNPMFDIPSGQLDVLALLNNGREFPVDTGRRRIEVDEVPTQRRLAGDEIKPGKGYQLNHPVGYCDGSYNAICKRSADSDCLLYAHHDGRGGLRFHDYSGWIVMTVPKVKHGIIMIKMETWHWADEVPIAAGWTTVNNEGRMLRDEQRNLKREPNPYCDDFHFEYSVDGNMTSWNLEQFQEASKNVQRVVEVFTMLDDASYVKEGEEKDVELAIRMRGCGTDKVFSLTHVYWA